ncbi:MAG: iron export ABC transporter permease subunit FetB [Thermoanaerobacteraceae bacterium]|nr:iron export ABC transporter permease subunit FetB [Thermoanaerobacteraceae bacterium]
MRNIIELTVWQLVPAYIFVVFVIAIVKIRGINREKEILLSSVRMTIQLVLVGYILDYMFKNRNPLYTIIAMTVMEVFAIYNVFSRVKRKISPELKRIIAFSMSFGTIASMLYFILIVIQLRPWYDPQYFIPLGGMIIGNSMTGITLGVERIMDGFDSRKEQIEAALMLGATPGMSAKNVVNNAFDSAILPTINSMVGMGIVFLPGMMTGQILSGTSPLTAIEYQIAIMLGILGSVSLTVILFVMLGYKTFFNDRCQLKDIIS